MWHAVTDLNRFRMLLPKGRPRPNRIYSRREKHGFRPASFDDDFVLDPHTTFCFWFEYSVR
jgi:hypothetical protein